MAVIKIPIFLSFFHFIQTQIRCSGYLTLNANGSVGFVSIPFFCFLSLSFLGGGGQKLSLSVFSVILNIMIPFPRAPEIAPGE